VPWPIFELNTSRIQVQRVTAGLICLVFILSVYITGISIICDENPEIMQQCFYYLIVKWDKCNVMGIQDALHGCAEDSTTFGKGFHIAHCFRFKIS
jgi:hypothetical protein